jgi:hypothetical protein
MSDFIRSVGRVSKCSLDTFVSLLIPKSVDITGDGAVPAGVLFINDKTPKAIGTGSKALVRVKTLRLD